MKKRRADERLFEELNLESLALARALIMEGRAFAGERKLKARANWSRTRRPCAFAARSTLMSAAARTS